MAKWSVETIPTFTPGREPRRVHRPRLDVLDSYDVIGRPVVGPVGLTYVSWVEEAVRPYTATRLPRGTAAGLADALRRAEHAA